jgi:hypothetical protein
MYPSAPEEYYPPVATLRPPSMQPKIFISHSAKDEFTSSLLAAIEEQLSAAGYYVLVDRTRLKIEGVGSNWRATLNQWLDICDGAILLISPENCRPQAR